MTIAIVFLVLGVVFSLLGEGFIIIGIIELVCGGFLLAVILKTGSGIPAEKKKQIALIADNQKKMDILKNIPTFDEYAKAHGIDSE